MKSRHHNPSLCEKKGTNQQHRRLRVGPENRIWSVTDMHAPRTPPLHPENDSSFLSSHSAGHSPQQHQLPPTQAPLKQHTCHQCPERFYTTYGSLMRPTVQQFGKLQERRILYYFLIQFISGFCISQFSKRFPFCFFSTLITAEVRKALPLFLVENNPQAYFQSLPARTVPMSCL